MRIMLACAYGMSTNMLVQKMKEAAKGKDYKVWAVDQQKIKLEIGNFDVLLLGPQITYLYEDMVKLVGDQAPVAIIRQVDYGRLNGANVVAFAEQLFEEFKKAHA